MATRKTNSRKSSIDIIADAINGVGKSSANVGSRGWQDPDPSHYSQQGKDPAIEATNNIQQLSGDNSFWSRTLGRLGQNSELNDFLQLLLGVGAQNAGEVGTYPEDLRKKLIELFLDNLVKNEQRQSDFGFTQEQRLYDSPTNQLARLMGAGISRDAAFQMLSQGGESPMVGSGESATAGEPFKSTTEQVMQGLQTASSFLSTVGSLVSLGFSIPQAMQQTQYLRNQNLLTQKQITAYNNAGTAFHILNTAGSAAECFGSVAAATKELNSLAAAGNTDAANFIANGGTKSMAETSPWSSKVLNDLYMSERSSKDYAKTFKLDMRNRRLQNDYLSQGINKMYADTKLTLGQLVKNDAEIQKIYQDIRQGDLVIEIAGQQIQMNEYALHGLKFQDDVLTQLEGMQVADQNGENWSAADLMSYNSFCEMWEMMEFNCLKHGDPAAQQDFVEYLKNNKDALYATALICAAQKRGVAGAYRDNGDLESSIRLSILNAFGLFQTCGASEFIKLIPKGGN